MKSKVIIAAAILLSAISVSVSAQSTLANDNKRIHQGVRSGELTGRETARLEREKAQVRREAFHDRANDGHIGPRERANLQRDKRRLDRNIYRQKHDRQRRY